MAKAFTDPHREALDWLNKVTGEDVKFFGVTVELCRIGPESPVAPIFKIVSQPNNWAKTVAETAKAVERRETSDLGLLQLEYWTSFNAALAAANGPVKPTRTPQPKTWMSYGIGRSGFSLNAVMSATKRFVRAELYISGPSAKKHFEALKNEKAGDRD